MGPQIKLSLIDIMKGTNNYTDKGKAKVIREIINTINQLDEASKNYIIKTVGGKMKDRDLHLNYDYVRNTNVYDAYQEVYEMFGRNEYDPDNPSSVKKLGKVLCFYGNFGFNSLFVKQLGCTQFDLVVLNPTHQKYCFNVNPEIRVDNFYIKESSLEYDTLMIDCINETTESVLEFIEKYCTQFNLLVVNIGGTSWHFEKTNEEGKKKYLEEFDGCNGLESFKTGIANKTTEVIRGKRLNDVILDEFPDSHFSGVEVYPDKVENESEDIYKEPKEDESDDETQGAD